MKTKFKKMKTIIFILGFLGCMSLMSSVSINADEMQPGEVNVSKTAKLVDGKVNTWDIELKVETKVEETTSDTVLVFDRSTSMNGSKLENAKDAANDFIDKVLEDPNSGNRIALVVFSDSASTSVNFTNNAATLKNAINLLTASGYTFTQAAIETADALLVNSSADKKQMVLLSDGQPTRSYALNNTNANSGNFNATAENGRYYTRDDLPSNAFNRSSDVTGSVNTNQPSVSRIGSTDRYYNMGNIAISASKWTKAKTDPIHIYTIAFDAGAIGTPILNEIASPGKAHQATEADLDAIFQEIAASILSPISDASVSDPMGNIDGVKFLLVPNTMQSDNGTPTYNSGTSTITWNISYWTGPNANGILSATLKYQIEIDPDGSKYDIDELDGVFATNGTTTLSYKDSDNASQTKDFTVPKVDPVFLIIEKKLFDSSDDPIEDREFDINVKGENPIDFDETYTVKSGEKIIVSALRDVGDYTVSEVDADKYDSTIKVNNVENDEFTVVVSESVTESMDDINVLVTNKEKDDGKITISKEVNLDDVVLYPGLSLPDTFSFTLTGPNGFSKTFTLEDGGSKVFEDLVYGEYQVIETNPDGFDVKYTPTDGKVELYVGNKNATISVENTPLKKDISVEKIWEDEDDEYSTRPDSIEVDLLYDGETIDTVELDEDNNWSYTFSDLAILDDLYTIEETGVPTDYKSIITSDDFEGEDGANDGTAYTITNSLKLKDISVEKVWEDEDDEYNTRPDSIEVNLLYGDDVIDTVELDDSNDWSHLFEDLPILDDEYIIEEVGVPAEYKSIMTSEDFDGEEGANDGTAYTITNSLKLKNITVEKVWEDEENEYSTRPEAITVNLWYGQDEFIGTIDLSDANAWSHTFENLPVRDDYYRVQEVGVPDYYKSVITSEDFEGEEGAKDSTAYTITNTLKTIDVNVEKLWIDQDDKYDMRPEEINVKITGKNLGLEFNATLKGSDWSHQFVGIPEDEYTLEEAAVDGYTIDIKMIDDNIIKLTNTLDVMNLTFKKIWLDVDNKFDTRPAKIELVLFKDQQEFTRIELNEENDWISQLDNIPIGEYKVSEVKVDKYSSKISNNGVIDINNTDVTITNTYDDEKVIEDKDDDKTLSDKDQTPKTGTEIMFYVGVLLSISGIGLGLRKYL